MRLPSNLCEGKAGCQWLCSGSEMTPDLPGARVLPNILHEHITFWPPPTFMLPASKGHSDAASEMVEVHSLQGCTCEGACCLQGCITSTLLPAGLNWDSGAGSSMPHLTPTYSEATLPGPCDTGAALKVLILLVHSSWLMYMHAGMLSVHVIMSEQGPMHCWQKQSHLMPLWGVQCIKCSIHSSAGTCSCQQWHLQAGVKTTLQYDSFFKHIGCQQQPNVRPIDSSVWSLKLEVETGSLHWPALTSTSDTYC